MGSSRCSSGCSVTDLPSLGRADIGPPYFFGGLVGRNRAEEIALGLLALLGAAVPPNIFPAAQAGFAKMSVLAIRYLAPSIFLLAGVLVFAAKRGHRHLVRRMLTGAAAGGLATLGLEAVRITSFHIGGMPGD